VGTGSVEGGNEPHPETGVPAQSDEILHVEEEGPTLPCLISFLAHLAELGIRYPSRKESWPVYESTLRKKHSEAQLKDVKEATTWCFIHEDDMWVGYFLQSNKRDLVKFYVDHTADILIHCETHQARQNHEMKKRTKVEQPADEQIEETRNEEPESPGEGEPPGTGFNPF
jgi:hypothetical protein